mmetsp:Transcript_4387/g.6426  ORF Transcript_4387/g.6426 Transcript_4387/m.6426 type:complete len:511 (-) Transcript_4387:8-1540(-)
MDLVDWETEDASQLCNNIGNHAKLKYEDLEEDPPVRPLDFPSPIVHRGTRITGDAYDSKRGQYIKVKNLLIKCKRGSGGSHDYINMNNNRTNSSRDFESGEPMIAYCLRRKLASTVYGGIYKGVVMKKRKLFSGENAIMQELREKKASRGTLESIVEENELEGGFEEISQRLTPKGGRSTGVWEATGQRVVIKASSWGKIRRLRGKHLEDPIKEIQAMQLIGNYHSHIVSHLDAIQDDYLLYNVMQYCEDGDLYGKVMSEINTIGRVDECRARIWFRQLLLALHHLQQKGVCHRDLSLENIMVHEESIKLIDFGLALRIPYKTNCSNGNVNYPTDVSEGSSRLLMTAQGQGSNWSYMSPEVVGKDQSFDGFAHDLWAAGVILYILLVGHKPFNWAHKSDKQFLQLTENRSLHESLVYWGIDLSDEACDLLQNMLRRNPRQRLSLAEIMMHPWVRNDCDSGKENRKEEAAKKEDVLAETPTSTSSKESMKSSVKAKSKWFQKKKEKCISKK